MARPVKVLEILSDVGLYRRYEVGKEGVIAIEDISLEFPDSFHPGYLVSFADNKKVEVNYCRTIAEKLPE